MLAPLRIKEVGMIAATSTNQFWRVLVAGKLSKQNETELVAKSCGAFESGYAGTLYFAFRDKTGADRFAAFNEQNNPNATIIVVNC